MNKLTNIISLNDRTCRIPPTQSLDTNDFVCTLSDWICPPKSSNTDTLCIPNEKGLEFHDFVCPISEDDRQFYDSVGKAKEKIHSLLKKLNGSQEEKNLAQRDRCGEEVRDTVPSAIVEQFRQITNAHKESLVPSDYAPKMNNPSATYSCNTLLQEQKKRDKERLIQLNGQFYEDPASALKQAWDEVIAFQPTIRIREDIDAIITFDATTQPVIETYLGLEAERNRVEDNLRKITEWETATPIGAASVNEQLISQRKMLLQRKDELCGPNHFDGLIDVAWQNYQRSHDETALEKYQELDRERKNIDAQLFYCEQHIALSASL